MQTDEDVTNTQHVAAMVSGHATNKITSLAKSLSYRIPLILLGPVDGMALKAGKSRNAMLNLLVSVGIDEVRKALSDEAAESLTLAESEAFSKLLDQLESETLEE